jgi:2-(1,2-epoxy-1,2-dihydrophenyl)acetyl-CoA isomerase
VHAAERVLWSPLFPGFDRQTLTLESVDALLGVIHCAEERRPTVLVLTGGSSGWCYGGDVGAFASASDRAGYIEQLATKLHVAVEKLHALDCIVITVVEGVAAGAGMPLAAAGDIVLASETARFTLGYTKIGLTPDGGTTLMAASMGVHRLLYATLVNPILDAAAAHRYGLVAEVLPPEQLLSRAEELANALAAGSASALAAAKHLIRDLALPDPEVALAREQAVLVRAARQPHAAEGVGAFVSKTTPVFT